MNINDIITYGSAKFKIVRFATSEDVRHLQNNAIPLGTILPYSANAISPPNGFLFCDGSAISRTTYSELFNLIGTTYGVGDESTTFNLPNLINKFIEGYATAGTNINAGLPNITGYFSIRNWSSGNPVIYTYSNLYSSSLSGAYANTINASGTNQTAQTLTFNAASYNSLYGNSSTVQPPAITMKYIIKAYME